MPNGGKKIDYILHRHRCLFILNTHLEWGKIFSSHIADKVLVLKHINKSQNSTVKNNNSATNRENTKTFE